MIAKASWSNRSRDVPRQALCLPRLLLAIVFESKIMKLSCAHPTYQMPNIC